MLSTDVKDKVIIFYDGSKLHITTHQEEMILLGSTQGVKGIKIDGNYYTFGSMNKIISIQEFYNQYPDERPDYRPEFKETKEEHKTLEEQGLANENRRNGLVRGLKQAIAEFEKRGENPIHAKAILERWENKQYERISN